jgi:hypothetical protein
LSELTAAFRTLTFQNQLPLKLCLFIDGLDEYDGDETEIANLFGDISQSQNTKCCVSSRPHLAFKDAFAGLPGLRLEDLTYPDIQHFVMDKLESDKRMQRLAVTEPDNTPKLIEEIVTSANGVFLWVKLVVASLLNGLGNHDQIVDLRARLHALPKDLERLYEHMVLRVDETYREEASRLFQLVAAAADDRPDNWVYARPLTILGIALAEDKDHDLPLTANMHFMDGVEVKNRCEAMMHRLISRCGGLLEIQRAGYAGDEAIPTMKVSYMYRTVKDYLETTETRILLKGRTGGENPHAFDPNLAILRAYILQLKTLGSAVRATMDPYDNSWEYINTAILYARRVDSGQSSVRIQLLDQLYKAALYWAPANVANTRRDQREAIFAADKTVYTFAVECGLSNYLSAKLDELSITTSEALPSTLLDALLFLALVPSSINRGFVTADIVSTLLDLVHPVRQYEPLTSRDPH